jgi:hypothetical protein
MTTIKLTEKQIRALHLAMNLADECYIESMDDLFVEMDKVREKLNKAEEQS